MAEKESKKGAAGPGADQILPTGGDASRTNNELQADDGLPPELALHIMRFLERRKSFKTLLEFSPANKEFASLALPILQKQRVHVVWLALSEPASDRKHPNLEILGALREKEDAQRVLEEELE